MVCFFPLGAREWIRATRSFLYIWGAKDGLDSSCFFVHFSMIDQKANEFHHKGRAAQFNPQNKFMSAAYMQEFAEGIDDWEQEERKTTYIFDQSKSIVNEVKSPDVEMLWSANPYQGCEHGCIYCYARNSHEYWGYSAGIDFESKIVVKRNAPELLRQFFERKSWKPAPISFSGNTDCYQPIERKMGITRALLAVCLEYRNPVFILTKNALVLRDLDLIQDLAKGNLVQVWTSITGTDEQMRLKLEPRTSSYKNRFKLLDSLARHDVPVGLMNAPIIPGLNDDQMHDVLKAASEAGARWAAYTVVRLNGAIGPLFEDWLRKAFPDRAEKVWNMIRACHQGAVEDSRNGARMLGDGPIAELIKSQFKLYCKNFHLNEQKHEWNLQGFRRNNYGQGNLFD